MPLVIAIVIVVGGACAPEVAGPVARQHAIDRADAARLTAQLRALPGVERVEVMLRRPAVDPLRPATPPGEAGGLSIVVIVDDGADREHVASASRTLARVLAPSIEPSIVVEIGMHRPELARVGPFEVTRSSRTPLKIALGLALAAIAMLAGWIALRDRRLGAGPRS